MTVRLLPTLLWLLAILFVAVLVHMASILAMPRLAPHDAFATLAAGRPAGSVGLLPGSEAGGPPYGDPETRSAVCRYDLAGGPLRVIAPTDGGDFVAVSFHSRYGVAFYALTDRASVDGRIEVLLVTAAQRERLEAADGDEPARDVRVVAEQTEGFVEFDVLPRIGGAAAAETALKSMSCKIEAGL